MEKLKRLSGDDSGLNFRVSGGGSSNKYGTGAGGRITVSKDIGNNTTIEAYSNINAFKPKSGDLKKDTKGYGVSITKRFKAGGMAKKGMK